jgi:hypothetical protein
VTSLLTTGIFDTHGKFTTSIGGTRAKIFDDITYSNGNFGKDVRKYRMSLTIMVHLELLIYLQKFQKNLIWCYRDYDP